MSLNDSQLRKLLNKRRDDLLTLTDRDSLSVRVTRTGKIVFQYRYRYQGRQRRYSLGNYPAMSLADARKMVPELRALASKGIDISNYTKQSQTDDSRPSLEQCVELFMDKQVSKQNSLSTRKTYLYSLCKYTRQRFTKPVEEISKSDWYEYFDRIEDETTGYVSRTLCKQLKACLRFCEDRGYIKSHELKQVVVNRVGKSANIRERTPALIELNQIQKEVKRSKGGLSTKNTILLLILTGARCGEVRNMTIKDIDFKNSIWTVPPAKSKSRKQIIRPLAPKALEIIKEQVNAFSEFSDYLFPSMSYTNEVGAATINKFCRSMIKRTGMEPWTVHDFRRSISTILVDNGVQPWVTEKMLGHSLGQIFATYNKSDLLTEQLDAYRKWESLLFESTTNSQY